ncbi:unnamed protein product [Brassicogethes aeneus]|uniref:Partial AB-hydrolase lipase domain-containing protein n=1 Tax=Brassicogethes aeneus TaxID=1431903 RepID=A0A9P0AXY2_BRAAE|nr:unnamed protein product [Brassicogethes aeneus]
MAAPVYFKYVPTIARLFTPLEPILMPLCKLLGIGGLFYKNSISERIMRSLVNSPFRRFNVKILELNVGWTPEEYDPKLYPLVFSRLPRGAGLNVIWHYLQLVNNGGDHFRKFDYGITENFKRYKSVTPPEYPLENMEIPNYFITSKDDHLCDVKDNDLLWSKLQNSTKIYGRKITSGLNHADFFFGKHPEVIDRHLGEGNYENYTVTTKDGYILTLFRIIRKNPKGVIMLQHPITGDGVIWVSQGNRSLGNIFSFEEIGLYDYPAFAEKISEVSNNTKIIFIGQSMACTSSIIYASVMPEHVKKYFKVFIQMATPVYFKHLTTVAKYLAPLEHIIRPLFKTLGIGGFFYKNSITEELARSIVYFPFKRFIVILISIVAGWTPHEYNPTMFPLVFSRVPRGSGLSVVWHYAQLVNNGGEYFRRFDYGITENLIRYKSATPPEYPLENMEIPNYFITSKNDAFCNSKTMFPLFLSRSPRGSGLNVVWHYAQLVNNGGEYFRRFDYGIAENLIRYKSATPPEYPLENMEIPNYFITSKNDAFCNPKDNDLLWSKLQTSTKIYGRKITRGLNHVDFHVGKHVYENAYKYIIKLLNKL